MIFGFLRGFVILASVALIGSLPALADHTVVLLGPEPPQAFTQAVTAAGFHVAASTDAAANADVLLIQTPFLAPGMKAEAAEGLVEQMLKAGKTVIVGFDSTRPQDAAALDPILPVNLWTLSSPRLMRLDSGVLPVDKSFPAGLQVSGSYDLHLPYAAIEAGEHRYNWKTMDKGLLNTDWRVLLASDRDGRLPLLVTGRSFAGTAVVFGDDLFDPALTASPPYPAFIAALLHAGTPGDAAPETVSGLTLAIPAEQSGPLHAEVTNSGTATATCDLVAKVSNFERGLLDSVSVPVTVPPGKTIEVPIPERNPGLGDPTIIASGDDAVPFLRVHAALTADHLTTASEVDTIVDKSPAITLDLAGDDLRSQPDLKALPERDMDQGPDISGGAPIYRYVYSAGMTPNLTITLGNGVHNVAPLAAPADLMMPDNSSVQGLNDLAECDAGLRGTYDLFSDWCGKSAAEQKVSLTWPSPVTVMGEEIVGHTKYRNRQRSNPESYSVTAGNGTAVATVASANYTDARHDDAFPATATNALTMDITGLDPSAMNEPNAFRDMHSDFKSNCAITEWKVWGWAGTVLPPHSAGTLTATVTDLLTGATTPLLSQPISLDALHQFVKTLSVPGKTDFGPERVDVTYQPANGAPLTRSFDYLFIAPGHDAVQPNPHTDNGLLCEPGYQTFDDFGMGTGDGSTGWAGYDNSVWCYEHDFMEIGTRNVDEGNRMFTSSTHLSHYTDPWRDFPSGQYFWDWGADQLVKQAEAGKFKNQDTLHIFLSDRWNGIPVGAAFTWDDFIAFDQYLRKTQGHGLTGRSRKQIVAEITTQYGDVWQKWEMNRYADALLAVQTKLATKGLKFTVTTHGSFPLVGGDLGAKIGQTHVASGTDLFWELRDEDLYKSIGLRFGLIAADPDLESGAYNEWGWNSGVLNNAHWYSYTGTVEPSRRQWYSTYFTGRVTSDGTFKPLTKYGYYAEGAFGVKNTENDWANYYRTMHFTDRVRPEQASGFGLVVSWNTQMRHMGKVAASMGTGLYVAKGYDNANELAGNLYYKLVRDGIPVTFVASTDTIKKWDGRNPLIVVDGFSYTEDEIKDLQRLNDSGTPIFAVGWSDPGNAAAQSFFGVSATADGVFTPSPGTSTVSAGGHAVAYATARPGRGATIFCPSTGDLLTLQDAAALCQAMLTATGSPLQTSPGVAPGAFVSFGKLFLILNDEGDLNRSIQVSVKPTFFDTALTGTGYRVMDMDHGAEIPATTVAGTVTFTLPVAASDGRLVMIVPK